MSSCPLSQFSCPLLSLPFIQHACGVAVYECILLHLLQKHTDLQAHCSLTFQGTFLGEMAGGLSAPWRLLSPCISQ